MIGLSGAGAAVATAAPTASSSVATKTAASSGLHFRPSRVHWGACPTTPYNYANYGLKCASIAVPRNYAHPHGPKIHLEVSIKKHDPSAGKYRGAILVNPGGPGGSGLIMSAYQQFVPGNAGKRYDWIGFDPRGVSHSRPALHCNNQLFGPDRPWYTPSSPGRMRYWRNMTRRYAKACGNTASKRALLKHMTTADNARDMNAIRKALGLRKISYYGFSWGSYLGQVYTQLFPHNIDREVLDGVVDPNRVWYGANLNQETHFNSNINRYWQYLAKNDSYFHLGTSAKAIGQGFKAEIQKLRGHPAAGGKLGPDELTDAMLDAGYYVYNWVDLGDAYANLIKDNNGTQLYNDYKNSDSGSSAENGYAVYDAVQCTDNPWPAWPRQRRDAWRINKFAPFLAWDNTWYNAPCMSWPVAPKHRHKITGDAHSALLIAETHDAATPFEGALKLRSIWKRSRLIEGVNGTTHAGSLSGVPCTDNTIAHYLNTGQLPARKPGSQSDKKCPPVPQPVAGPQPATTPGTTARPQVPSQLRKLLQRTIAQASRGLNG